MLTNNDTVITCRSDKWNSENIGDQHFDESQHNMLRNVNYNRLIRRGIRSIQIRSLFR
jgi:hypothetical protein